MRADKVEQAKAELKDCLEGELIIQDLSLREFRCSDGNGLNNISNDGSGDGFSSLYSGC